jgi:hypothetical protein
MYTACTHRLVKFVNQPILDVIPRYALIIALAAWLATFLGLLQRLFREGR